jgi:hypothetical protein
MVLQFLFLLTVQEWLLEQTKPAQTTGHVRIYDYNGSAWVQVGADH